MSTNAQGGQERRPTVASAGKRPGGNPSAAGRKTATKPGNRGKAAGSRPNGKAPGGPRRQVTPVKVGYGRNWGAISLISAVAVLAVAILGYGGWAVYQGARSWEDRAAAIEGLLNYRKSDPKMLEYEKHTAGPLTYRVTPAVGGTHNNDWQNCMGDVYEAPIAQEHAVHSLEHGAVWITYRPDLAKDQVDALAAKVRGKEKMMMSPHPKLDSPISLQAWGYQLKVDNADDGRIDEFIKAMRVNASIEGPNASCAQGITATGETPRDLQPQQQTQQQTQQ